MVTTRYTTTTPTKRNPNRDKKLCDSLQAAMTPTNNKCQNGFKPPHSIDYREEQPRSTRIVVAYPQPAFSATKKADGNELFQGVMMRLCLQQR